MMELAIYSIVLSVSKCCFGTIQLFVCLRPAPQLCFIIDCPVLSGKRLKFMRAFDVATWKRFRAQGIYRELFGTDASGAHHQGWLREWWMHSSVRLK